MVDVYYPYFQREAIWQELRYSLRSVEKHLKEEFRVWIVGDLPDWVQGVHHIPHDRVEGIRQNTTYDAIIKLLLFCDHPDTCGTFIRMYDDIYLLSDVDAKKIGEMKALYRYDEIPDRDGTWWDQLRSTLYEVVRRGYPGWNTETHFPELFDKLKMRWIIQSYSALQRRLLTSSLYFNTFFPHVSPELFRKDWAIQFYGEENRFYDTSENVAEKCQGKLYLNHNNFGLNEELKAFLTDRFPEKSRFEI